MFGVLEFNIEVVLPAAVDGGVRDTSGAELGGEGCACAVEGELVVGVGDTVGGHDEDQESAGGRDVRTNCFLVVAKQEERRNGDEREQVAIEERIVCRARKEKQKICTGKGHEKGCELLPGNRFWKLGCECGWSADEEGGNET